MRKPNVVVQNKSTKRPLVNRKKQEEKSDSNRNLMQKAIAILEKRQNSETKSDGQFDNYGKYIACTLRGMPEKDSEYVQFKIQEIIYQVKSYGINHSFQTAIPHFPGSTSPRFSTPNQSMQRKQSLE